jgi:hypothetical protein
MIMRATYLVHYVVKGDQINDTEANEDDIGVRVRQRPQAVEDPHGSMLPIFLTIHHRQTKRAPPLLFPVHTDHGPLLQVQRLPLTLEKAIVVCRALGRLLCTRRLRELLK